jgi:hypothetical protein
MRSSLYPRVPQDWDEWEAPRGMNVPLPAVLVYGGSSLLQGDPLYWDSLHWCIFRTEWVIAFFSRFVADAHHRCLLWRLPVKVTTSVETLSVETLSVETLLEGSPYRPDEVHQLLKLQAEYNWEGLTRAGYTVMQAVPLNRVGEECKIYDLPLSGVPERATGSDEGSEVEEILASGQIGNPVVPGTPPSLGVNQPLGHLSRDLAGGRERASVGMTYPWRGLGQDRTRYAGWTARPGPKVSSLTRMDPSSVAAERDQYRQPVFPSASSEAYVTIDPYGGVRQVPESECIVVREVEEYLRYNSRSKYMRAFTRDAPLTSETVGRALCVLIESRKYHRYHGANLTRRIQGLVEQQMSKALLYQETDQSLRLLNTELNGLTQRLHHQTIGGVEDMGGGIQGTGGSGSRKSTRTGL